MTSSPTPAVLPDARALDRAEAYAKSPHTTPEEHDDIMVAVRLARRSLTPPASDAAVLAGFVLVPVEPTMTQLNAAVDATGAGSGMSWEGRSPQKLFQQAWSAMLSSIPKVTSGAPIGEILAWLESQTKQSRTGISFDWVPACEGEPSGFRFMRRHHVGQPCKSIAEAICKNGGPTIQVDSAAAAPKVASDTGAGLADCDLGVGCEQHGVCYAEANGKPEQCGRQGLAEALRASLAKRSIGGMDPPYTAAFNAALDMVGKDVGRFLATPTDATDGAGLRDAAQFLSDRLDELEWMDDDLEATCRDYMGHVDPAHDRLKSALAADATDGATGGGEVN